MKRLAFIRYLYDVGIEQSSRAEPLCASSILTFHDCIELFLELAAEHLDEGKSGAEFMQYWELLKPRIEDGLTQKESCRQLNTARVGLKHGGILPSRLAIEGFRATTTNFLKENTTKVFELDFSGISLIDLVKCEATKESLTNAETLLKQSKLKEALENVAVAFAQLIDDYEDKKKDEFGRSPFLVGKPQYFLSNLSLGTNDEFGRFADKIEGSIKALQAAVKILSLGIQYRKYARFRLLTPEVTSLAKERGKDRYLIQETFWDPSVTTTKEDVQFCVDFVIESALVLQEFDFSVEREFSRTKLKDVL